MEIWAGILGGIGLFLLGIRLMTEGLAQAAGAALKTGLEAATQSRLRGLAVGVVITAIVQSSTAVIVAVIGFSNAGLMSFASTVWVIYGTHVGTTTTGWLVALIGVQLDVGAFALPLLGLGMLGWLLAKGRQRLGGAGEALAGFGAFFLGIGVLQAGFADLAPQVAGMTAPLEGTAWEIPAFMVLGVVLATLTQSSSAAVAIVLTAGAGGTLSIEQGAASVIGANIGTTSTALLAAIGATPAAKRVAATHVGFSLLTAVAALAAFPLLIWIGVALAGGRDEVPLVLAVFHTLFNVFGVMLFWPLTPWLVRVLSARFEPPRSERLAPRYLDSTLTDVPDLALRALALEMDRLSEATFELVRDRLAGPFARVGGAAEVLRLGETVRGYISEISRGLLPPVAVDALSDTLRGLQHIEELAEAALSLPDPPARTLIDLAPGSFAMLDEITRESCTRIDGEDAVARLDALGVRSEEVYAGIKHALLRAAASGQVPMARAEDALAYARAVRGLGRIARKAQRRLASWRVSDPVAAGEPEAPSSG